MKMTRYSEPQILAILRQAEGGVPVSELCREHGMRNKVLPSSTFNPTLRHVNMPCRAKGKPQQNAYIERYNRTVRHEWPPLGDVNITCRSPEYIIENIKEAQDFATQWLWTYNNDRPNMGIGGRTPAQKLKMAA